MLIQVGYACRSASLRHRCPNGTAWGTLLLEHPILYDGSCPTHELRHHSGFEARDSRWNSLCIRESRLYRIAPSISLTPKRMLPEDNHDSVYPRRNQEFPPQNVETPSSGLVAREAVHFWPNLRHPILRPQLPIRAINDHLLVRRGLEWSSFSRESLSERLQGIHPRHGSRAPSMSAVSPSGGQQCSEKLALITASGQPRLPSPNPAFLPQKSTCTNSESVQ